MKVEKQSNKRFRVLANCPQPQDIGTGSRSQYSVKSKRAVAKYAIKHNLSPKEVTLACRNKISTSQARNWVKDQKAGLYHISNAVCVHRGA